MFSEKGKVIFCHISTLSLSSSLRAAAVVCADLNFRVPTKLNERLLVSASVEILVLTLLVR